ncbi:Cytochrome c oxidase assembly protein cox15 [Allomyces javanicus]|nr:Cytochrome c oxidase assembly protein cox15 [Allomyces javanicus]
MQRIATAALRGTASAVSSWSARCATMATPLRTAASRSFPTTTITTRTFASLASRAVARPSHSHQDMLRRAALRWSKRFQSTATAAAEPTPAALTHPVVGKWFLFSSSLVFGIVVVGGITRLTESGLSITEWNVIRGMKWPSSTEEWAVEFDKYQQSPEYKLLNHNISLEEFKNIFYWEWFHRNLGRTIGMVMLVPTIFFTFTRPSAARIARAIGASTVAKDSVARWMAPGTTKAAWACCVLVGFQGALGWYMVKSGLEQDILDTPNATPRVSQYRLAAHLGSAFVIYVVALWNGMQVLGNWKTHVTNNGINMDRAAVRALAADQLVKLRKFAKSSHMVAGLVFLTALSGAFVAGLDAGLVYNTWPLMGDNFIPPMHELFPAIVASSSNGHAVMARTEGEPEKITLAQLFRDNRWKNVFENQVTVQLDHRLLAYTTFAAISAMWLRSRALPLPPAVRVAAHGVMGFAVAQVTLGIATVLYFVPIQLAAAHQGGSLALLSSALYLMHKTKHAIPRK